LSEYPSYSLTLLDGNRFVRVINGDNFSLGFQRGHFKIENSRIIGTADSTELVCGDLDNPLESFVLYPKLSGSRVLLYPEYSEEMPLYTRNRAAIYSADLSKEMRELFPNRPEDSTCISLEKEERDRNILTAAVITPIAALYLIGLLAVAGITYSTIANWPF